MSEKTWTSGLPPKTAELVERVYKNKEELIENLRKETDMRVRRFRYARIKDYGQAFYRPIFKWLGPEWERRGLRLERAKQRLRKLEVAQAAKGNAIKEEDRKKRISVLSKLSKEECAILGWNEDGTHAPLKSGFAKEIRSRSVRDLASRAL